MAKVPDNNSEVYDVEDRRLTVVLLTAGLAIARSLLKAISEIWF